MNAIRLQLKTEPTVPLEAEVISPDRLVGLSHADICRLPVYHGRRQLRLDDFFEISGERSAAIELQGDLRRVRHVGRRMSHGSIQVRGDVGMHLGSLMTGGRIEVHGSASDWVGAEMCGGEIRIHGDAGQQVGAAYRGSPVGVRGGTIAIDGDAGIEVGQRMRRGLIVIGGRAKDFVGLQMKGGTIVLGGGAELRAGAWMQRGTILSLTPLTLMPTFTESGCWESTFVRVLARHLAERNIDRPQLPLTASYVRYVGDRGVPGKGEILVHCPTPTATGS